MAKGDVTKQERDAAQRQTCQQWIRDCCNTHPLGGVFTPSLVLYENFKIWQTTWGGMGWTHVKNIKGFVRMIVDEGFRSDRQYDDVTGKQVRGIWNIALRDGSGPIKLRSDQAVPF